MLFETSMIDLAPRTLLDNLLERSKEIRTACGEADMVWRIWGPEVPERPPLVLLHGGFGAWNHWVRNIPVWEKEYQLVVADLPGCGDSASLPRPYDAEDLARIVIGVFLLYLLYFHYLNECLNFGGLSYHVVLYGL